MIAQPSIQTNAVCLRPATDREFEDFLRGVRPQAVRLTKSFINKEEDVQDVVQIAMIEMTKCRTYTVLPPTSLPRMFNVIHRRCIVHYYRRRKSRSNREVLYGDFSSDTEDFDFLSHYEATDSSAMVEPSDAKVEREQILALIDEELSKLPEQQQKAFFMRYVQDMDLIEIATSIGRSAGVVGEHCKKARTKVIEAVQARLVPACPKPVPVADRPIRIRMPRPPRGRPSAMVIRLPSASRIHRPAKPKYPRIEALENGVAVSRFLTHDIYIGAADALVSAGIIEDGMLPGRPGRPSKKVTIKFLRPADGVRYIQLIERAPGCIEVRKAIPDAEASQRRMGVSA